MKIGLVRHFKVNNPSPSSITSHEFEEWVKQKVKKFEEQRMAYYIFMKNNKNENSNLLIKEDLLMKDIETLIPHRHPFLFVDKTFIYFQYV